MEMELPEKREAEEIFRCSEGECWSRVEKSSERGSGRSWCK